MDKIQGSYTMDKQLLCFYGVRCTAVRGQTVHRESEDIAASEGEDGMRGVQVQDLSNDRANRTDTCELQLLTLCIQQNARSSRTGVQKRRQVSFVQYDGKYAAFSQEGGSNFLSKGG